MCWLKSAKLLAKTGQVSASLVQVGSNLHCPKSIAITYFINTFLLIVQVSSKIRKVS